MSSVPSQPKVVVVGGGLAGLATAAGLAEQGVRSIVLESRPRLGGRASSIIDPVTNDWIDNCHHVALGCCTNFRHWTRTVGVDHVFQTATGLDFLDGCGRLSRLAESSLPAPLHLAPSFALLKHLSFREQLALARGVRALAIAPSTTLVNRPISAWLHEQRQPQNVIDRFWNVVLVSALSESLDRIHAAAAKKVICDSFLANRTGWRVDVPVRPLDELYGPPLQQWCSSKGVELRMKAGVDGIRFDEESRPTGVRLRSGELLDADVVVLAVPWMRVAPFVEPTRARMPELDFLERFEAAPIASVHLWFDRPITDRPHIAFVDGLSQWLFARDDHPSGDSGRCYYQVVVSASRTFAGRSHDQIAADVVADLASKLPLVRNAALQASRVIIEHHAVFSPLPGSEAWRPRQRTSVGGLYLAGDWTRTGWPATMEGAVRSGYLAAEAVLADMGRPARVTQPDLPTAPLSRWVFGGNLVSCSNGERPMDA